MSTTASRYAEYGSACPRCQQIISTIDITFQQGIFIYDLTFIQQELESVLVAALQRQNQLLQEDGEGLQLPSSSMIRLPNGKKPRDFKAERDRRRKALSGHVSRKRRARKSSTVHLLKAIKHEHNENGFPSFKKTSYSTKNQSEINGNSSRPIRSYRSMNFTFPYDDESTHRNGNHANNKFQIINTDQFWTKLLAHRHEYLKSTDWSYLEKLIEIDQSLLDNFDYEKEYNQHKQTINSKEYLFSQERYIHPELEDSIALKRNAQLYNLVENLLKKNSSVKKKHHRKRKYSAMSDDQQSNEIDPQILDLFRRENNTFSSKYAELQYRLAESISLERLALHRAEEEYKVDQILLELNSIDEKILEITNSIRQRKRPSENALSLCKPTSPVNNHSQTNGYSESEAWRKGRRQSTLRVYDELARLIEERVEFEKQITDGNRSIQSADFSA